ncbi:uncharacterized protein [Clytia hemisphaerica]|uniref:uncharacterized protein n=1 Tax=Clytia hemisphaerica TaxID=252671 RepID=UPI0034D3B062
MEKSPEKMNKDQHEVKEDLKSESKPLETINPFDCQENNADSLVKIRTKDQKVILIDHMMLLFISDAFENIIENEEGQKFIDASEFSPENIVQAISFHLPRFNGKLNDKCDFAGLLSICSKWSLSNYRNHIEEYLLTQHKAGIEKFNGCLQPQHLDILHLADRFQLEKILTKLMSNLSSIGFEYSTNIKVSLEKLNREIKYEILKTLIVGKATRESMAASVSMELDCIFNFLDLLIFEDRVLDMYAKNKFKDFASHKEYLIYSKLRKEDFTAKQRSSDVKLVVNGDELFVNPYILSNNSPVLKDMLVKAGKENDGDCLNLLWKSTDEIVLLLTFLTKSMELNGDCDLYTLASLCKEYKIEWLMLKIEKFVQDLDMSKLSAKETLVFLKLSSIYGFTKAEQRLVNQVNEDFLKLQMHQEFTWLNTRAKVLLARKRLWSLLKNFQEKSYLLNELNVGLLSVLKDYKQYEFEFSNRFPFDGAPEPKAGKSSGFSFSGASKPKAGKSSGFSFGEASDPWAGNSSGFSFGGASGTSKPKAGKSSGFSFGGASETSKPKAGKPSGFSPGEASDPEAGKSSGFSFGGASKPDAGKSSGSLFGGASKPDAEKSSGSLFAGASKPDAGKSSGPLFGGASKPDAEKSSGSLFAGASKPDAGKSSGSLFGGASKHEAGKSSRSLFAGASKPDAGKASGSLFGGASKHEAGKSSGSLFGGASDPEAGKPTDSTQSSGFKLGEKPVDSTQSSGCSFGGKPADSTQSSGFSFGGKPADSSQSSGFTSKETTIVPTQQPKTSDLVFWKWDCDLYTLASLCEEYKIEWLMSKIEKFVQYLDISKLSAKETLLYLKLSSIFGFTKAEQRLVNKIDDKFPRLQVHQEFTWLNTRAKVLLARKRLWNLLKNFQERSYLLNKSNVGLLSVLQTYEQTEFEFNDEDSNVSKFSLSMRHISGGALSGAGAQLFGAPAEEPKSPGYFNNEEDDDILVEAIVQVSKLDSLVTGKENEETIFENRSKLYRFDSENKQWKERGLGVLKITRTKGQNSCRVLMRRDQVHKLCANHAVVSTMEFKPLSEKSYKHWTLFTQADFSEEEQKPEYFCAIFKTSEIAKEFKEKFDECIQIVGGKSATASTPVQKATTPNATKVTPEVSKSPSFSFQTSGPSNAFSNMNGFSFTSLNGNQATSASAPAFSLGHKATEKAKPTTQAPTSNIFSKFAAQKGAWECETCLVENEEEVPQCLSCETANPNTPKTDTKPVSATASSGFSFGNSGSNQQLSSGFSFGGTNTATNQQSAGFPFGNTSTSSQPASGFSFGAKTNDSQSSGFSFGGGASKADPEHSSGFSFGKVSSTTENTEQKPSFSFAKTSDNPFSQFTPGEGSWECDACLIENTKEVTECESCETPKPTTTPKKTPKPFPTQQPKASDLVFWKCQNCFFKFNREDSVKCICCWVVKI